MSLDGVVWETVRVVAPSDSWDATEVDLGEFSGHVVHVRFVFNAVAPADPTQVDAWRVEDVEVDATAPRVVATERREAPLSPPVSARRRH